jgi:pimeloyl-ACP methyl ester carboxylesterase
MLYQERPRRSDRSTNYDPAHEIHDLITVLDIFEASFGKPSRTLQYGHSGGGHVALAMSEIHPDRIDGAVAGCAHTQVWLMNSELDGWFVLKALLAPELPIVDRPTDLSAITAAWRQVINAAQQTPLGRARIALATTLG